MSFMSRTTQQALTQMQATKALSVLPLKAIYHLPIFVIANSSHAKFSLEGSEGRLEWEFCREEGSPSIYGWDVGSGRAYIRFDSEYHTITVNDLHKAIVERSPVEL